MKWPWRRRAELYEPRIRANFKLMELETPKKILAGIFLIQPADVEEMIQSRLEEERSLPEEENLWQEERREKLWPATFCLSD